MKYHLLFILLGSFFFSPAQATTSQEFTQAEAMKLVLQHRYEANDHCGNWELTDAEQKYFMKDVDGSPVESVWRVCPYQLHTFKQGSQERAYLLLQSNPAGPIMDCHICSPLMGSAIFEKQADGWKLLSQTRHLAFGLGTFGQAPPARFVKMGSERFGIWLESSYSGMGTTTVDHILLAEVNGKLAEVWRAATDGDNHGMVDIHPYYAYQSQLKFVPVKGQLWPDLYQYVTGTAYREDDTRYASTGIKPVSVKETRVFKFDGQRYRGLKNYFKLHG